MPYHSILLATDLSSGGAALLDYAFEFGEQVGAKVHTVHAVPVFGRHDGDGSDALYESAKHDLERAVRNHRSSPSMGECFVDTHEPITSILRAATTVAADLIILGTHARQGAERVLLGSVAQAVLEEAKAPVLVIRTPSGKTQ